MKSRFRILSYRESISGYDQYAPIQLIFPETTMEGPPVDRRTKRNHLRLTDLVRSKPPPERRRLYYAYPRPPSP